MKVWIYILQSEINGRFYVGITSHLRRRIKEHNSGNNKSTASLKPWKLIHREPFEDY
jgi:putative endonuclease